MELKQFKDDLFKRYVTACDEMQRIAGKKSEAVRMVYAGTANYDVEKYKNGKIPPGGSLLDSPPENDPSIYGLDVSGRPCYSRSEGNKCCWEGFYHYSDSLIEYIEYDLDSGKPVAVHRLFMEGGRRAGFQRLNLNGKSLGRTYAGLTNQEIVEQLQVNPYDLICIVELYRYENGRIHEATCWDSLPGIGPRFYKKIYSYSESGALDEIRSVFEDYTQYSYVKAKPKHLSLKALRDQLARVIADIIADTLQSYTLTSPAAIMQLGYREIANYHPYIHLMTLEEQEEVIKNSSELLVDLFMETGSRHIPVKAEAYDRLYTAFMNKVEEEDDYEQATAMIRKVAYLLTTEKLAGVIPLAPGFIAFAVDWSMVPDEDELLEIMEDCGMSSATIAKWQKMGVL